MSCAQHWPLLCRLLDHHSTNETAAAAAGALWRCCCCPRPRRRRCYCRMRCLRAALLGLSAALPAFQQQGFKNSISRRRVHDDLQLACSTHGALSCIACIPTARVKKSISICRVHDDMQLACSTRGALSCIACIPRARFQESISMCRDDMQLACRLAGLSAA
jgi:hypothetical protein